MAEKRMFSKVIIDSDNFIELPLTSQLLYFHLAMRADDEGFVDKPKSIMRMCSCKDDDIKILIAKSFIIPFESGIIVIRHWNLHNTLRKDRVKQTLYKAEKLLLNEDENGAYLLVENHLSATCQPNDNQVSAECPHRLDKIRLDKIRLDKISTTSEKSDEQQPETKNKFLSVMENWNNLNVHKLTGIKNNREKMLNARIKEHGIENVLSAIKNISKSDFLQGKNNNGWTITFDWFLKPNNFVKVFEGNYDNKGNKNHSNTPDYSDTSRYDDTTMEV